MQTSIRKIGLIVLLILVLPLATFFIYQFASLNEYEKEINKIYVQQLETIIYSVNQYSEDVVTSWINRIIQDLTSKKANLENINAHQEILISTILANVEENKIKIFSKDSVQNNAYLDVVSKVLTEKKPLIQKLRNYLESGYQKIEPIGSITNDNKNLCLFPLRKNEIGWEIGGIIFDPSIFIQQALASKILQAAGDEFILAVINNNNNKIVFSSERTNSSEIILQKPLWLLPGLSIGIKLKSGNIQDLVSQRFYTNLIILGLLLFILVVGMLLIFFNLRREIRLAQLKSDFIANVSHELRTPLALISMYSETLALNRLKSEEKKQEYYSVIHSETTRLSKIVNSILNFSKMEKQSRKFHFEKCNLIKINNEVFKTYEYHIKSKGFSYSSITQNNAEEIFADIDAISESIINLIDNAIKYSNFKREFEINISNNNVGPYWEIKDFGIGINSHDQKKIFDKFYRVSSGLVNSTKGTGLGLSLIKQIMEAHSGNVTVKSSLGEGSTFRLQFNKNFNGYKV